MNSLSSLTLNPKKCAGFLIEQMDGEVVLMHPGKNIIIHSNETAALIWQLCDGSKSVDDIVELLSSAYPDAREQIAKDVPETVQLLRKQGALDGG
jgi:coenzyme PQQ biosynthesis protein PqqD